MECLARKECILPSNAKKSKHLEICDCLERKYTGINATVWYLSKKRQRSGYT